MGIVGKCIYHSSGSPKIEVGWESAGVKGVRRFMGSRGKMNNASVVFIGVVCLTACNVYDGNLIKDAGITKEKRGDSATSITGTETIAQGKPDEEKAGSGGSGDASTGNTAGSESRTTSQDASAADSAITVHEKGCGDGLVSAQEKCDVMIDKGQPGYCPRSEDDCPKDKNCSLWRFNGKFGCTAECNEYIPVCQDGDGCCPTNCTSYSDSDCSGSCGNGIVEKDKGETCEKPRDGGLERAVNGSAVCPTSCPEDGNPCTRVELKGSAENCNASCDTVEITSPIKGDNCCPKGADAVTDSDCPQDCGNGVREGDEVCDGTPGCDERCSVELTAEQQKCVTDYGTPQTMKCDLCMCVNCLNESVACYENENQALAQGCIKVVDCAYKTECIGSACYCGTATRLAIGNCLFPEGANGPCKDTIEQVAGTTNLMTILQQQIDPTTALGRAQALSDCYDRQCLGCVNKTYSSAEQLTP